MFPLTRTVETRGKNINLIVPTHVETVCLLSKLSGAKHHVEVELNLEMRDYRTGEL